MKRRHFLLTGAAAVICPTITQAAETLEYAPGLVSRELGAGKTVFLDFKADWCITCARQERVINALRRENPAYDQAIVFINVDWDQHRRADLTRTLNIPRRSTLVALKGDAEIGRIVAGTSRNDIKALMDAALSAATG